MFDYPDPEKKVVVAPYLEIEDGTMSIEQYTIPIDASVSEAVATLEDQQNTTLGISRATHPLLSSDTKGTTM